MKQQKNDTKKSREINQITEGVIWKQILLFFFPIVLGTLFQQLYNTVDAIVVGRFVSTSALACVGGSTGQIINLIVNFFVGLSSGATVIIGRYYGAKDTDHLDQALHTASALAIVGSIIISVIGLILSPTLLRLMNTPADVVPGSTLYLRIYFGGILFVFIYNIGSAILRAMGDSRRPLYFLIVCCLINILLDLLFVMGFHMGVAGVAIATLASQAVSAILVIYTLMKKGDLYQLIPRKIRFHKNQLHSIVRIGLPAGVQSVMYNIANVMVQVSVNALGTAAIAANTADSKIDAVYWMISGAFSITVSTFVSQNYGAGKYSRMHKSVRTALFMDMGISLIISAIFLVFGRTLFLLFTSDATVIDLGMQVMRVIAPSYAVFVFIEIFSSALRGLGDVLIPMIMTCCGVCVVRILWLIVAVPHFHDMTHIMLCYPISWAVTTVFFIFYYIIRMRQFDRAHHL